MGSRSPHRGANGDIVLFAQDFIQKRAAGLMKDTRICLTDTPTDDGASKTHAYFPALATSCGFLEYMTGLHRGRLGGIGWQAVVDWATKYLQQPDYAVDTVRILFDAFRHSVAHRGIATGIWVDRHPNGLPARRITWKLYEDADRPACHLASEVGELTKDPPWPCPHTHRMHIHLGALAEDLCAAATAYANDLANDPILQGNFVRAMHALYPR
jgi:hypothetical protein